MADFDWWPRARLQTLAVKLRTKPLPPVSNLAFWREVSAACQGLTDDEDGLKELAQDVHNEVAAWNECVEIDNSAVIAGDLSLAESRVMLMMKGVKGIVYAASHQMDPLWKDDGIQYHTLYVSISSTQGQALATQLESACAFLRKHKPCLVCSSCPRLRATIMAAAIIDDGRVVDGVALPRLTDVQAALDMLSRSGLGEAKDLIGSSEWDALEAFAEMHDEHPLNPRRLLSVQKSPVMAGKRGEVEAVITPKSKRNKLEADVELDGCEPSSSGLTPTMRKSSIGDPTLVIEHGHVRSRRWERLSEETL